ncbi:MAG: calcium-binding protein [Burkholderiales bacterium]
MRKTARLSAKYLDKWIEEATTDAYNESEQAGGFFAMIEENLALPFMTRVLGQDVTVTKVDITRRDQIVTIYSRGKARQAIPILDLPMPAPRPEGAEWIDAYRRWRGS